MSSDEEFHSPDEMELETDFENSNIRLLVDCDSKCKRKHFTNYYFSNGRNFIHNIQPWTYNNPLKLEHVQAIKDQLKISPYLTGVFSIVELDSGKLVLLDGHHRHRALLNIYEEDGFDEELEMEIHCYRSDTINSNQTTELFQKLNHTKPFPVSPIITITVIDIIREMDKKYPGALREGVKRANFPNIHKETLNVKLHQKLAEIEEFTMESIFGQIKRLNRVYRKKAESIVVARKKDWPKIQPRLERHGLYLGIVSLDEWMSEIQ